MTAKMRLIFEKGKWNDKRDTPAAAPPPCRLHFLMFSALHAEKAALLRRKNAFGRTAAFLAPRMPSQNKKAIPSGMTFCLGGETRDRTADLMTASHALSQLSYTPIGLGYSSRYGGKLQALFSIFRNFFEEVRFRRKGGGQLPRKTAVRRLLPFPPIVKDENGPLPYCPRRRCQRRQAGEARSKSNLYFEATGERHPRGHFRMETSSRASVSLQRL